MTYPFGSNLDYLLKQDPKMVGVRLARYKWVSKMLKGFESVLEIGAGSGFGAHVVRPEVKSLTLCDLNGGEGILKVDYTKETIDPPFAGIYALDVLEHVEAEDAFMRNVCESLKEDGTCIIGIPSLESQAYACELSKAGHVNCKTEEELRSLMKKYFKCVYLFGMNDEVVHTGFGGMCHYRLALANSPR